MCYKAINRKVPVLFGLFLTGLFCVAQSAAVFVQGPALEKQGDSAILINFTVSESTDVEIGIANASGKIINHLAAGVLGGEYPPPEPLVTGLTQSIIWNITDDDGNRVFGDDYKVRVRLGVKPKFVWKNVTDRLWKPSLSVTPGVDMWGDWRNLFWQPMKTTISGKLDFIMIPDKYNTGNFRYAYTHTAVTSDSAIMVMLKVESDFYVAERDDQLYNPYLERYTTTGEKIVTGQHIYYIYKAHGQAGDRMFLPPGTSSGGTPIRFCFIDKASYVQEGDDPWNTDPQMDFLCKWHPMLKPQTPGAVIVNSIPGTDIFSRNSGGMRRYDASTGQEINNFNYSGIIEGPPLPLYFNGQFGGRFLAYDTKAQLLYINNPMGYGSYELSDALSYGYLFRFNMWDYSPAPWPQTGSNRVGPFNPNAEGDKWEGGDKGTAVGPDGAIYVNSISDANTYGGFRSGSWHRISVVKDGEIIDSCRIRLETWFSTLKVDRLGNIYVGCKAKPRGFSMPEDVQSLLNPVPSYVDIAKLSTYTASILKFKPTGGGVLFTTDPNYDLESAGSPRKSSGMEWCYFGFSKVTGYDDGCWCSESSFDMDKWGRLFVPDAMQAAMTAIDNNRNVIYKIRNRDISEAAIIPGNIAVTENYLIVGDWMNASISGFLLTARDSSVVAIPEGWVGINERAKIPGVLYLSQYPNPAFSSTQTKISVLNNNGNNIRVSVFNLKGELVSALKQKSSVNNRTEFIWDTRDLAGGLYLIKAVVGNNVLLRKTVVMK